MKYVRNYKDFKNSRFKKKESHSLLPLIDTVQIGITDNDEISKINEKINILGLSKSLAVDVVQFMIGAAAEYGIAASGLPVYVVGAVATTPIGMAVETVIDGIFASEAIASSIKLVNKVKGKVDKFKKILDECFESYSIFKEGKFDEFYEKIISIVKGGIELLKDSGVDAEKSVDKIADELKETVEKLIRKLTDAISKGLKLLIPDATAGLVVAGAIKGVVEVVVNNGYNIATGAVDKLGEHKKYIIDPEEFPKLLDELEPLLYKLIDGFKTKIKKMSWAKVVKSAGAGGVVLKKFGPKGLDKLKKLFEENFPKLKELAKKILQVVIPVTFLFLALIQILLKKDYKNKDTDKENKNSKTSQESDGDKESKDSKKSVPGQEQLTSTLKTVKEKNPEAIKKILQFAQKFTD